MKRSVKFDEDRHDFMMDIRLTDDAPWKRVRPDQAKRARAGKDWGSGPAEMTDDEIANAFA